MPSCEQCDLLKARYREQLRDYIEATRALELIHSDLFIEAYEHSEHARHTWEKARHRLNIHLATHQTNVEP